MATLNSASPISQLIRSHSARDDDGSLSEKMARTLRAIRTHLEMDVAFVSEFSDGYRFFRYVDSAHPDQPVKVGGSNPLDESYCQRVIDGRLPELIHDAGQIPTARELPVTAALPVGAHLSVPIRLSNGDVYGTFCCFSFLPNRTLTERDLAMMRVFAELSAEQIEIDVEQRAAIKNIERRIDAAVAGDALSLVYQPIFHVPTRQIVGFEALSRFATEPYRSPDVWFAEAAEIGMGAALERKAIELALEAVVELSDSAYLSVNVSPERILRDELPPLLLRSALDRIVLEVTEHESVHSYAELAARLKPLRRRGLRIAVDDAGAGYASFRHILNLAPDIIKLDASITRSIDTDFSRRALAAAFIRFAEATDSEIVAEGVETSAELLVLGQLGVTKVQGNFLAEPGALTAPAAPALMF